MRILLAVEPGADGAFRHVESLAQYLLARAHEVHFAYSDWRGSVNLRQLIALVEQHGGSTVNLAVRNRPEPGDPLALWRLWSLVRRVRPELIHSHSSKAGVLARALVFLGVQTHFFYTPHAYYGFSPRRGFLPVLFNAIEKVLGGIGTTITISRDENRFALERLKLDPRKVRLIPNPVDPEAFSEATPLSRRAAREQLGLPPEKVLLGMLGRFSYQKNPAALYRALAPVLAEHPELLLVHVGRGELEEEVQRVAEELGITRRVHRISYLDQPAAFYHAIDALAMPSRYEGGWNNALLEALATGLPIITTVAPGISDLGRAGLSHCWTVPMEDDAALTAALRAWLADRPQQRPNNHRQVVLERHSLSNTFERLEQEYAAAVAR